MNVTLTDKVSIKKARAKDLPYIYSLYQEEIPTSSWTLEDFHEFSTQKYNDIFSITLGKVCVGFIMLTSIIPESDLINIAIQKPLQNIGIGGKAIQELFTLLQKRGVANIYLEVRKSSQALNFYVSHGFQITAYRKKYYADNEDAVLMERQLV